MLFRSEAVKLYQSARGVAWFGGQILGAVLEERRAVRAEREYQRAQQRGANMAVRMLEDGSLAAGSLLLQRQPDGSWRPASGVTTKKPKGDS